ncbi:hypothetical protein D3C76_1246450 [compost metagenome]
MAVMPPAAMPEESNVFSQSGANCKINGCWETPIPTANDSAMIMIARRFRRSRDTMRTPDAAMVPNITRVAPPNTGSGMCCTKPATAGNSPSAISISATTKPT